MCLSYVPGWKLAKKCCCRERLLEIVFVTKKRSCGRALEEPF